MIQCKDYYADLYFLNVNCKWDKNIKSKNRMDFIVNFIRYFVPDFNYKNWNSQKKFFFLEINKNQNPFQVNIGNKEICYFK